MMQRTVYDWAEWMYHKTESVPEVTKMLADVDRNEKKPERTIQIGTISNNIGQKIENTRRMYQWNTGHELIIDLEIEHPYALIHPKIKDGMNGNEQKRNGDHLDAIAKKINDMMKECNVSISKERSNYVQESLQSLFPEANTCQLAEDVLIICANARLRAAALLELAISTKKDMLPGFDNLLSQKMFYQVREDAQR